MKTPLLYSPLRVGRMTLDNRWVMSPMCQYSAIDGLVQPWHVRHYEERALGGVGLIIVEATAVQANGRISPADLGLWNDVQREALRSVVDRVHHAGAKIAIQLGHAGRKASTQIPWLGSGAVTSANGGWDVVSTGPVAFDASYPVPRALGVDDIARVVEDFAKAASRAVAAGFDAIEIHAAHGYLLHQFLSPLTNHRTDAYGSTTEGRFLLLRQVSKAIRAVVPKGYPLFLRVSATDWVEGGWTVDECIVLLKQLSADGVDFVDVSSGGLIPGVKIPVGPGYQVPLAAQIRAETGLPTGAVGLITSSEQAESILSEGQADAIIAGRLLLRDPWYPNREAPAEVRRIPSQYLRAF